MDVPRCSGSSTQTEPTATSKVIMMIKMTLMIRMILTLMIKIILTLMIELIMTSMTRSY